MKSNVLNKISKEANFFQGIPKEELKKLFSYIKKVSLKKDDYFLKVGEIPKRIGYVRSGILRLYYLDKNGKEITKHFCTEHSLAISYSSFIKKEPSRFYIQALENTKLATIDFDTYTTLLNSHNCWQITARKLAEMVFILKEKREAEFLLDDAQARYNQFLNDFPNLINRIKHHHISSYLGITPESLSRIRANIK